MTGMGRFLAIAGGGLLCAAAHAQTPVDATGAQIFATAGCSHCHGETGLGTDNAPSLRHVRQQATAAQMVQQITAGGQVMPPFGEILDAEQIGRVVAFLRDPAAWKGKPSAPESKYKAPPLPPVPATQP